jgi:toxin secretion/phage lysis holin
MFWEKYKRMIEQAISFGKYLWLKLFGAIIGVAGIELISLTDEHQRVIKALAILVIFDSILGVWTAYKNRRLASWKMGQPMALKIVLYFFAVVSVLTLAGAFKEAFSWAPTYVAMFFCLSEILSVFEKLSLLGLQLPIRLVSKVNELFEKMTYGDKEAERQIIEKR